MVQKKKAAKGSVESGTGEDIVGVQDMPLPSAVGMFKDKCTATLSSVKSLQEFRESDSMVDYVVTVGRSLFDTPLDQHSTDSLLRIGGKLTGAFAYLGQQAARARAERDVYEQKAKEVEKALVLQYVGHQYKVTEAKARASEEMVDIQELVIAKEAEKNQWEAIVTATQTMIMFIQSAIKVKENERYSTSRSHDNAG